MSYLEIDYLSNIFAELIYFHFKSKIKEDHLIDMKLHGDWLNLQFKYNEAASSHESIDSKYERFIDLYDAFHTAKSLHLSRWHIDQNIQAQYAGFMKTNYIEYWLLLYSIEIKGVFMTFQCSLDEDEAFNYQLSVTKNSNTGLKSPLNLVDHYLSNKLNLNAAQS